MTNAMTEVKLKWAVRGGKVVPRVEGEDVAGFSPARLFAWTASGELWAIDSYEAMRLVEDAPALNAD